MDTEDPQTCGKGLAENAIFPAALGNAIFAMAKNLEVHMKALDLTDSNAKTEYAAYENLVSALEKAGGELQATAREMSGYRDLPMARHDMAAMTDPRVREAFEQFILRKKELTSLLQQTSERDAQLLDMMHAHGR